MIQKQTFDELLESYDKALRESGYGHSYRTTVLSRAGKLIQWHEKSGYAGLNDSVISKYLHDIDQRLCEGKIKEKHHRNLFREIERFLRFCESGSVELPYPLKGSRYRLIPEFQYIADNYLESGDFHPNTKNDMRWVSHKYFVWLAEQGYSDISNVGATQIQGFLLECSKSLSPSSMHNIKLYMKKLYEYLYVAKLSESSYKMLFSFSVNRESKIYPALPMSDVAKLLSVIDKSSKSGKRVYAMMILGAELGMRACDIINLRLDDINWVYGEIKIVQSKTNNPVVLPLTKKVGEALYDYILNSRPKTEERHVFLRFLHPYTPLKSATSVGEQFEVCCRAAGLKSNRAFHTLRRSLATAMVTNGVETTIVAQVLGDADLNSTQKYIALDRKHLKRCALSFDGITPINLPHNSATINPLTQGGGA